MSEASSDQGWIKLWRSGETRELLQDPLAFALLAQIAVRARWREGFNVHNLKPGEALIGDYEAMGLSRQEYRTRLDRLEAWKFVTTKTTNKGTIATICKSDVFDINFLADHHQSNQPATSQQPSANHPVTTNKEGKKGKKAKKQVAASFEEADQKAFASFWSVYPRKVNKVTAGEAWQEHGCTALLPTIVAAVIRQKSSYDWRKDNGKYVPHPTRWINHRRWEDEPSSDTTPEVGFIP